jgi:radical SAM protein with 4Fe4S-binding SPASM domain
MRTISTVIIKPTKFCNAQCSYCSSPPEVNGAPKWSLDDWKRIFDKTAPYLTQRAVIIWHGGEPMLMGTEFYERAYEYATKEMPEIKFSMQSNILAYDSKRWGPVFRDVFKGSVSTSYDPDETNRLIKGDSKLYSRIFFERLEAMLADGFRPKVIGTYTNETIHLAESVYERSLSYGDQGFNIRVNYRYPAGRNADQGECLSPRLYGEHLIKLYDRWIKDVPVFVVTPVDELLKKASRIEFSRCPWTRNCVGHFLGIEPNGDTYNCAEFADFGDLTFRLGNIFDDGVGVPEMFASDAARQLRRRQVMVPDDCKSCPHFYECEGGCMRDALLYGRGIYGKFFYCQSWKMVLTRIKESIRSGEADNALRMYGVNPDQVRIKAGLYGEDQA